VDSLVTDSLLSVVEQRLLAPSDLSPGALAPVFSRLLAPGVDYADLYFQHTRTESWSMEDGIVKSGAHSIEQGVGARAISGEKTGFAYSDEIRLPALLEAAGAARAIARSGGQGPVPVVQARIRRSTPSTPSTATPRCACCARSTPTSAMPSRWPGR
jgi:TldD protein